MGFGHRGHAGAGAAELPFDFRCAYGEQNSDLMRDPEIVSELSKPPLCGLGLSSFYFRNELYRRGALNFYSRYRDGENYVCLPGLYEAARANSRREWDKNLRAQGVSRSLHGQSIRGLVRSLRSGTSPDVSPLRAPSLFTRSKGAYSNGNDCYQCHRIPATFHSLNSTNQRPTPHRVFDEASLKELAASIRSRAYFLPCWFATQPRTGFEIVGRSTAFTTQADGRICHRAGAHRPSGLTPEDDRGSVSRENLIRAEIHPMEEAEGFARLLALEEPKYSIEQIAARVGKQPSFVASRMKLIDLVPAAVDAFYANEIGVGHALYWRSCQPTSSSKRLSACFKEVYNGSQNAARILLPVRNLHSGLKRTSCSF